MPQLSREYIDQHRAGIQSYESLGRALTDAILEAAADELKDGALGEGQVLELPATVQIRPVPLGIYACLQVCVIVRGVKICVAVHGQTARQAQDRVVSTIHQGPDVQ